MTFSTHPKYQAWICRHRRHYLKDPNITLVGVGYEIVGGKRSDEICIQFTAKRKWYESHLEHVSTHIPEHVEHDGVQIITDVVERTYELAYQDPIRPGISISHPLVSTGTLGAIVYDKATGKPAALSNWHVLHGPDGSIGDATLQPGTHDEIVTPTAGSASCSAPTSVPLATVRLPASTRVMSPLTFWILTSPPTEVADPELGDQVVKSGRTTGVSHGVVTRIDTLVSIDYGGEVGEQTISCFETEPDPRRDDETNHLSDSSDYGTT
ncbi:S1 family peptidase [Corynebacterium cystitidis]|uniref:S1 family peptidase n=1 Tax=Corynebacterium cystitidis TaxID=35757 RepID=UPI00211DD29E|nr:S1 family peptidase [Corynebacterium cystitidis]